MKKEVFLVLVVLLFLLAVKITPGQQEGTYMTEACETDPDCVDAVIAVEDCLSDPPCENLEIKAGGFTVTVPGGGRITINAGTFSYDGDTVTFSQTGDFTTKTGTNGDGLTNGVIRSDGSVNAIYADEINAGGTNIDGATNVDVSANGDTVTAQSADRVTSGGFDAFGASDISITPTGIHVGASDRLDYEGSSSAQVIDFDTDYSNIFTIGSADIVTIGTNLFKDITNAIFDIFNGNLVSADITSDKENNTFTFDNPIPLSSEKITITANKDDIFHLNYTKLIEGKRAVEYAGDTTTVFRMGDISFVPRIGGKLIVIEGMPPNYIILNGILNYSSTDFIEILDACSMSNVFIDYEKGFKLLSLSPFTEVLCPGGRYSYIHKVTKQISYSILNTGLEYYELGFNKAGLLSYKDFTAALIGDKSFGYVDFPNYIELNGIIEYDRYREFNPSIELLEEYLMSSLIFMPVYKSFDNNKARLGLIEGKDVDFYAENRQVRNNKVLLEVNSGFHKITEVHGSVLAYEDYNRDPRMPPYVIRYKSFFGDETEVINIIEHTLSRLCSGKINFFVYTPGTNEYEQARSQLKVKSGIARVIDFTAMQPK
ncbi:hypothetical protein KY339_03885 [Candidatus Woesearchaeota archaeon]|nr:hypothetical protein [Candidatus Woesearchaeota archaeon]